MAFFIYFYFNQIHVYFYLIVCCNNWALQILHLYKIFTRWDDCRQHYCTFMNFLVTWVLFTLSGSRMPFITIKTLPTIYKRSKIWRKVCQRNGIIICPSPKSEWEWDWGTEAENSSFIINKRNKTKTKKALSYH